MVATILIWMCLYILAKEVCALGKMSFFFLYSGVPNRAEFFFFYLVCLGKAAKALKAKVLKALGVSAISALALASYSLPICCYVNIIFLSKASYRYYPLN